MKTSWLAMWSTHATTEDNREQKIGLLQLDGDDEARNIEKESGLPVPTTTQRSSMRTWCQTVSVNLENLKPAWLQKTQDRRLHSTSYLDGLRGAASFLVFIHHSSLAFFPAIRLGFGAAPQPPFPVNHNYMIQLPIIRLIYSGAAMVDIFFVISGAVLSIKPLRLAREGEDAKLIENLSSSAFRRGLRLYIPCMVSTFFTATASMLGLMLEGPESISRHYPLSANHSWIEQFRTWIESMLQFVRPNAIGTIFEPNLWTIPIEFRGSMMIFLCALGVAKLRSGWVRTSSLILLDLYWIYLGWWEMFLFLSGMLISEFSFYRAEDQKRDWPMKSTYGVLTVLAVYLLSMPEKSENLADSKLGYGWLWQNFSPQIWAGNTEAGRFWPCVGAVLLVTIFSHAGSDSYYQRFFTTRFMQYLGRISFSFYLWHGLVVYTVGAQVMTAMQRGLSADGWGWWLSLLVTELAMLPTLFWISDLSTIYVDRAAVSFGKWLMNL